MVRTTLSAHLGTPRIYEVSPSVRPKLSHLLLHFVGGLSGTVKHSNENFHWMRKPAGSPMSSSGDAPLQRDELTSLLSLCGTLAGLCIGIVAFINGSYRGAATAIDDVLAVCAA